METRVWIGGGSNSVYAAQHWSPASTPQPGDTLNLYSGVANMAGGNLAGDVLHVGTQISYSPSTPDAVVNLSRGASLDAVAETSSFAEQNITFNIRNSDTLHLTVNNNTYATMTTKVNIAACSRMHGTVVVEGHNGTLTVTGGAGSSFDNNGASAVNYNSVAAINTDVVGAGSFSVAANAGLSFLHHVGSRQTIRLTGNDSLNIGDPHHFRGLVSVENTAPPFSIELAGILNADSYTYEHNLLTLYHGSQPIDTLRLAASGTFQVSENASGILIGPSSGSGALPMRA